MSQGWKVIAAVDRTNGCVKLCPRDQWKAIIDADWPSHRVAKLPWVSCLDIQHHRRGYRNRKARLSTLKKLRPGDWKFGWSVICSHVGNLARVRKP